MDKCNKIIQEVYTENYKMLLREIQENPNNGTVYHQHGLNKLALLSQISPKLIYIFNSIHTKILAPSNFL